MIFNGIEKDYMRVNMELFRPPTPPIEFQTSEMSRGGSRTSRKRFTDMILPVPITIDSDRAIEHLKEEISGWLYHAEPKKLIFKQIPDRYYLAEYESMELNEKYKYAKGVINFYLAEAYRFGKSNTLDLTPTMNIFEIKGQIGTPWTTRTVFTVPQSRFTIEAENGLYVLLNYNFVAGDVLEVGYYKREVKLNGRNLVASVSMSSVWKQLEVGYLNIKSSANSTLRYDERYL